MQNFKVNPRVTIREYQDSFSVCQRTAWKMRMVDKKILGKKPGQQIHYEDFYKLYGSYPVSYADIGKNR